MKRKENSKHTGQLLEKCLSPVVILSMEKTMVAKVISELSQILDLRFFQKLATGTVNLP